LKYPDIAGPGAKTVTTWVFTSGGVVSVRAILTPAYETDFRTFVIMIRTSRGECGFRDWSYTTKAMVFGVKSGGDSVGINLGRSNLV
jgi:hypothetical protein